MPAVRREHPYIWTAWLPRLLTGENSCEWAVWFKAHYQSWERVPSDFDQAKWMLDHTALLNQRIAAWTVGGHDVIVDAKTGHDSPSHAVQVMIYLYAIPRALQRYRNAKVRGQVTYRDHTVRISAEAVDEQFIQNLGALIRRLSSDEPAQQLARPNP